MLGFSQQAHYISQVSTTSNFKSTINKCGAEALACYYFVLLLNSSEAKLQRGV